MEIKKLKVTCSAAPAQLEGTTDSGLFFYARARFNRVYISVADTLEAAIYGDEPWYVLQGSFSTDPYASSNPDRLTELTKAFLAMIE